MDQALRFWRIGGQLLCSAALLFTNDFELGERIQIAGTADGSLGRAKPAEPEGLKPEARSLKPKAAPPALGCYRLPVLAA